MRSPFLHEDWEKCGAPWGRTHRFMENHDCCLCRERVGTIKYRKRWYCNDCHEVFVATGSFDDPWLDHVADEQQAGLGDTGLEPAGNEMWDDIKDAFRKGRE
jgi:hypothetical protein